MCIDADFRRCCDRRSRGDDAFAVALAAVRKAIEMFRQ